VAYAVPIPASSFTDEYRQGFGLGDVMADFLSTYLVPIAIGAVVVVLLLGLVNMMRGGSPSTSQNLMRWRVILQFVAIIVIMTTIWVMHR
jgi:NADH:ubiquinone oxidoreductase subunit 6 (subunit J)